MNLLSFTLMCTNVIHLPVYSRLNQGVLRFTKICVSCLLPKLDIFFRVNNDYDVASVMVVVSAAAMTEEIRQCSIKCSSAVQSLLLLLIEKHNLKRNLMIKKSC